MRASMQPRTRWIAVVVALLAASSFALAVQSPWWSIDEIAKIGPFGTQRCFTGECSKVDLRWLGGTDLWMRSAVATTAAGYIAMFALLLFAGGLAAKREPRLVARGTLSAIVTALVVGVYFFGAYPGAQGASIDRGLFVYAAGIVLGVAAVLMFLRSARRS